MHAYWKSVSACCTALSPKDRTLIRCYHARKKHYRQITNIQHICPDNRYRSGNMEISFHSIKDVPNPDFRTSGLQIQIRTSGIPGIRNSENPVFRNSQNPEMRKFGHPEIQICRLQLQGPSPISAHHFAIDTAKT